MLRVFQPNILSKEFTATLYFLLSPSMWYSTIQAEQWASTELFNLFWSAATSKTCTLSHFAQTIIIFLFYPCPWHHASSLFVATAMADGSHYVIGNVSE